jgi:hypothetical protein
VHSGLPPVHRLTGWLVEQGLRAEAASVMRYVASLGGAPVPREFAGGPGGAGNGPGGAGNVAGGGAGNVAGGEAGGGAGNVAGGEARLALPADLLPADVLVAAGAAGALTLRPHER